MFFVLLGLALFSVVCVFPYVLTIQGETLSKLGIPIGLLFAAQLLQCLILFSVTLFFGLLLAKKTGFRLPVLEAILKKENYTEGLKKILGVSVLIGAAVAIIIYVLDPLFTTQGAGVTTHANNAPVWQTLLAAFYGGITEELLMRLFVMTFFVWIGMKLFRQEQPTWTGIIIPIVLAAVVFGLGHLPITASVTAITPLVVLRAVILNGIAGITFGWLFWKKGLESAIIAHFTADIVLLTLLPLIF